MSNTIILMIVLSVAVFLLIVILWVLWVQQSRIRTLGKKLHENAPYQELERQMGRTLDQSLGGLGQRMSDSLARQSAETAQNLGILREKLGAIDAAQQQFRDLGQHVTDLKNVLGNRQARGAMGEMQLENLLHQVLPTELFHLQVKLSNGSRADSVVHLPNPPSDVVVDAKFPLEGYQLWLNASDAAEQGRAKRQFEQDVRRHIDVISSKYILPGETADFALMFLPAEAVYAEIFASLTNTVEYSFKKKVFLVSPTTLMATLNTVRAIVRDVKIQHHNKEVQRLVALIAQDVARLQHRAENVQRHFSQTQKDLSEIQISTEQITRRAEKIAQVGLDAAEKD